MSIRCGRVVQTPLHARGYLDTKIASRNVPAAPLPVWVATACVGRHCLCGSPLPVWVGHSCPTPLIFLLPCGLHIRCGPPLPVWVGHSCPTPLIFLLPCGLHIPVGRHRPCGSDILVRRL